MQQPKTLMWFCWLCENMLFDFMFQLLCNVVLNLEKKSYLKCDNIQLYLLHCLLVEFYLIKKLVFLYFSCILYYRMHSFSATFLLRLIPLHISKKRALVLLWESSFPWLKKVRTLDLKFDTMIKTLGVSKYDSF